MEHLKHVFDNSNYSLVDLKNKKKHVIKDYEMFYEKIFSQKPYYLAEIPLFPSPVLVDVDIKKPITNDKEVPELYGDFEVQEIMISYIKVLDQNLQKPPNEYKVILFTKKPRIVNDDYIKHGFHLQFVNVFLSKNDLKFVYEKVQKESEFFEYIDDVHNKPWLLYGALKSDSDYSYSIKQAFSVIGDDINEVDYRDFFIGETFISKKITAHNVDNYLPCMLSIRSFPEYVKKYFHELKISPSDQPNDQLLTTHLNVENNQYSKLSDEKIADLVYMLSEEISSDYNSWVKVGLILASTAKSRNNVDFYKGIFRVFSMKSSKYDENVVDNKWECLIKSAKEDGVGLGSLIYILKKDQNIENVKDLLYSPSIHYIPTDDYEISKQVKEVITDLYLTHKDYGCFRFDVTTWVNVSGWDNILKNEIKNWGAWYLPKIKEQLDLAAENSSLDENHYKAYTILKKKINNYSSRNNICKALFDDYFSINTINIAIPSSNKTAFKNAVLDLNSFQIIPGDPEMYLGNRLEHDYIPWENVPLENKFFVEDFYEKLFPDPDLREYVKIISARFLTTKNVFKHLFAFIGEGNNGKSAWVSMQEEVFGSFVVKAPKAILIGEPTKTGSANPEVCRLKYSRLAIVDELTKNDYLDAGQCKKFSGNDTLSGRDLYQVSTGMKEFKPMFFMILVMNEPPIIKSACPATWSRIRLINFEAKFCKDPDSYKKEHPNEQYVFNDNPHIDSLLKENAKYFLSYLTHILLSYKSIENFNSFDKVPEKCISGLQQFKDKQNIFKQYIDENFYVQKDSNETISFQRFVKEYNMTRPKIIATVDEAKITLNDYAKSNPGIIIINDRIRGLVRVTD